MSRSVTFFLLLFAPALAIILALLGLETLKTNLLGWFLLLVGIAYPVGVVIIYWIRKEPFWDLKSGGATIGEEAGDRSFWLILPGMLAAFFGPPLEYMYLDPTLPRTPWMQAIGTALVLCGAALFTWARHVIQSFYSGRIAVTTRQQLVQSGPYRFVRHPAYVGYILIALGLVLGYSSLAGLAAILLLLLPSMIYRIGVEDKLLARCFGAQFDEYARKTKRLIPRVW